MFQRKLLAAVTLLALFSAALTAQDVAKTASSKSGEFPFTGEVATDQLNVRILPGTAPDAIIVAILKQGDMVTVCGEKDGFYAINPPKGAWTWIWGKNLQVNGATGVVVTNDAPVRIDARSNAKQVGTLAEGTKVHIIKEHLGWYKIEAPDSVKFWVAKKYIKSKGAAAEVGKPKVSEFETARVPDVKQPAADDPGMVKYREAEELFERYDTMVKQKQIDDVDFFKVAEMFEEAASVSNDPGLKQRAFDKAKACKSTAQSIALIRAMQAKLDDLNRGVGKIPTPPVKGDEFQFKGTIDVAGAYFRSLGRHKLLKDNKVVAFLKVKEGDAKMMEKLNSLYQKRVGVLGSVHKDPEGWEGYTVIIVEKVVELKDEE